SPRQRLHRTGKSAMRRRFSLIIDRERSVLLHACFDDDAAGRIANWNRLSDCSRLQRYPDTNDREKLRIVRHLIGTALQHDVLRMNSRLRDKLVAHQGPPCDLADEVLRVFAKEGATAVVTLYL